MKSHERERMENLVRYMARPAIAEERLALLPDGSIRLQLKTSWRDGTQFLLFTPSEFIEKLIALVPLPKFHLTRYYGVFAKASKYRDKLPDRPPPKPDDADDQMIQMLHHLSSLHRARINSCLHPKDRAEKNAHIKSAGLNF